MRIDDVLILAGGSLSRNRNRSLLTMLGIIIGVGSVVLMTGVGASMKGLILGQISSIGAESMVVFPGQVEGAQGVVQAGYDSLTFDDVEALSQLQTVDRIAPGMFLNAGLARYGREESSVRLIGTVPDYFLNREVTVAQGRLIELTDVQGVRNVIVLGSEIAEELFGRENPLDKRVTIDDRSYTVIGVLESVGTQFFQNADEFVFIPLSTAKSVSGQSYVNVITMHTVANADVAIADVEYLLRRRHGIANPEIDTGNDDFIVRTAQQATDILGSVSLGLTLFITTIAAISLVVGGIGIMNIMLVSVTERTREIGLRKALGARPKDILLQFLFEAILLTVLAGVIGVLVGIFGAWLVAAIVQKFLDTYIFQISVPSIGVALCMACITGLVFGIFPARKASKLSPISALRYE